MRTAHVMAGGLLDMDPIMNLFTSATVDVFVLVSGVGWLILRMVEFAGSDWSAACQVLPPVTLDPGDWELHSMDVESTFVPDPGYQLR